MCTTKEIKTMTKDETMYILEKFFGECLRFWEHELNVSSDLDKQPFINAIKEIPHRNPYRINGEEIDKKWREEFRVYRLMDCYGRDYKRYL